MRILLTNDDGYLASGIRAVFDNLLIAGHDVVMVAPERNSSGAGQSIAVYNPISITKVSDRVYFVASTPADSVRLGLQEIYGTPDKYPDLIISGINLGENLAEDVLYSGTVGAAREGALHNIRSLAFSTNGVRGSELYNNFIHMESAARIVTDLVTRIELNSSLLPKVFVWNVNIPNKPYNEISGYETTRLGLRPIHQPLIKQETPRSTTIFWQGHAESSSSYDLGSDLAVFNEQTRVSITPLELLPTNYEQMPIVDAITTN